jgi:hypothetical protein
MADKQEYKFPSETIDLPSKGKLYPKDSPLSSGKIEIKYMTAKEEDILTSQNLIKKGVVVDRLLNSLILTEGVNVDDLILGDKNAVMVAARILAYGPDYNAEITDTDTGIKTEYTFNLADCPFKHLPEGVKINEFDIELPISKQNIKFRLLTGKEEKQIEQEVKSKQKIGNQVSAELTTRLKYSTISIDGETDKNKISILIENMLSRDSLVLRNKIAKVSPDIELKQDMEIGGTVVEVDIPLTTEFFWPSSVS